MLRLYYLQNRCEVNWIWFLPKHRTVDQLNYVNEVLGQNNRPLELPDHYNFIRFDSHFECCVALFQALKKVIIKKMVTNEFESSLPIQRCSIDISTNLALSRALIFFTQNLIKGGNYILNLLRKNLAECKTFRWKVVKTKRLKFCGKNSRFHYLIEYLN